MFANTNTSNQFAFYHYLFVCLLLLIKCALGFLWTSKMGEKRFQITSRRKWVWFWNRIRFKIGLDKWPPDWMTPLTKFKYFNSILCPPIVPHLFTSVFLRSMKTSWFSPIFLLQLLMLLSLRTYHSRCTKVRCKRIHVFLLLIYILVLVMPLWSSFHDIFRNSFIRLKFEKNPLIFTSQTASLNVRL